MKSVIKWTAMSAAAIAGASFAYAFLQAARQRVDAGLAQAEQMADDARRVLDSTRQTVSETQQTVRHLRSTIG